VKLNQTANLSLLAEELEASLRVQPTPAMASVAVDGVPVGHGTWEGRLRAGGHTIEVSADGYLPFKRDVDLKKDASEAVDVELAHDPAAFAGASAAFGVELDAAAAFGLVFGGDLASSCSGPCSASVPLGPRAVLHAAYQGSSGFGVGVDVGYLLLFRTFADRPDVLTAVGGARNSGSLHDDVRLSALTAGLSAQYHKGAAWPLLLRFGAGLLVGSAKDDRAGTLENSKGETYTVGLSRSAGATYVYFAPEARIGRRIGKHFELNVGAEILLMAGLTQPKWSDNNQILTTNDPRTQGDGVGTFGDQKLLGGFIVHVTPGVGARYEF
jgi:hypothetical protein